MHSLVTRDKFVGEGQSRHETTLLEPEDRGKRTGKEDTFNSSKSYQTRGKCGVLVTDPFDGPVSLLSDTWN
jgi:hypothetical protein